MNKTTQLEPELPELPQMEHFPCDSRMGFTADQMRAYALSAIAADRNKREGEPAATAVPYGWINAGTDRQQTEYATLHVGPENPWKETANAFPVYAAPVSAGLSDEEKSNLQELIRYLEAVDAHAQADTVRALAARLRLPEGWVAVPLDPSPEMVEMGVKEMFGAAFTSEGEEATRVYRAMIAAAHNEVQDKPMPGQQEE